MAAAARPVTVLLLGASPPEKKQIQVDEWRAAVTAVAKAHPFALKVEHEFAAKPSDLVQTLARVKPNILHIHAHIERSALILSAQGGSAATAAWAEDIVAAVNACPSITLIVLDGCNGVNCVQPLVSPGRFVIAANTEPTPEEAIHFSRQLYQSLCAKETEARAVEEGNAQVLTVPVEAKMGSPAQWVLYPKGAAASNRRLADLESKENEAPIINASNAAEWRKALLEFLRVNSGAFSDMVSDLLNLATATRTGSGGPVTREDCSTLKKIHKVLTEDRDEEHARRLFNGWLVSGFGHDARVEKSMSVMSRADGKQVEIIRAAGLS